MTLNGTTLLVLATLFLVVAAAQASGPRWRRRSVILCTVGAAAMQGVLDFIVERQLGHCAKVHTDYAAGVRVALSEQGKS